MLLLGIRQILAERGRSRDRFHRRKRKRDHPHRSQIHGRVAEGAGYAAQLQAGLRHGSSRRRHIAGLDLRPRLRRRGPRPTGLPRRFRLVAGIEEKDFMCFAKRSID